MNTTAKAATMHSILPGESIATQPNGNIILTMRNGTRTEFTPDEWAEYNAEFMSSLSVSDMVDMALDSIKSRQMVETAEMVDILLDIRKRSIEAQEGSKRMAQMWSMALRKIDYITETVTDTGRLPDGNAPEGWQPKWMFEDDEE